MIPHPATPGSGDRVPGTGQALVSDGRGVGSRFRRTFLNGWEGELSPVLGTRSPELGGGR
jgi:hypothetical protein